MDRQDWKYSSHSLRELMYGFVTRDTSMDRVVKYRFASVFNPLFGYFHIWDGIPKQTIGTIKLGDDYNVLRYFPDTEFKYELQKFESLVPTKITKSPYITRHDEWVSRRVGQRVDRAMRERVRFLVERQEEQQSASLLGRFGLRVPFITTVQPQGTISPYEVSEHQEIEIVFDTPPNREQQSSAVSMVTELQRDNRPLPPGRYSYEELRHSYRSMQEQHAIEAMEQRMSMRPYEQYLQEYDRNMTNAYYNQQLQTFYGRPVEQVRDAMRYLGTAQEGTRPVNEHILEAVEWLDEQNVGVYDNVMDSLEQRPEGRNEVWRIQ